MKLLYKIFLPIFLLLVAVALALPTFFTVLIERAVLQSTDGVKGLLFVEVDGDLRLLSAVMIASAVLIFLLVIWLNHRFVSVPVRRLREAMRRMTAGDLEMTVERGSPDEFGVLARDVDALRVTLKRNVEREQQLSALKDSFIRVVSHQLRTPLNAIRWNLESLLSEAMGKLTAQQRDFVRVTYDADVAVIDRVQDLLVALDIEEGRIRLKRERMSVRDLFESVVSTQKMLAKEKKIDLTIAAGAGPAMATIDIDRIREAMTKIIDNAIAYTPERGTIEVRLTSRHGRVRFACEDNGVGIPEKDRPNVFTRFFRASNASNMRADASGLGLSIAKYFVEAHDGSIGFTTEERKGTTMWFEIPTK